LRQVLAASEKAGGAHGAEDARAYVRRHLDSAGDVQ